MLRLFSRKIIIKIKLFTYAFISAGNEPTLTGEQAFNILRKNYVRLQECLPVNDILPELFAKAVVLESEFLALQAEPNEVKQRRQLATYLLTSVRRQESNFQTVCDVLLKTAGVEDLGRTLLADGRHLQSYMYSIKCIS